MKDNFNDNSIDTAKWDETDPNSRIAEQNNRLEIDCSDTSDYAIFVNKLQSDNSLSSGVITVQCNLNWGNTGADETQGGLYIYKDNNNYAYITARGTGGNQYRIGLTTGGTNRYNNSATGITPGKDVKIEYTFTGQVLKFYYWSGSAWTQMGATQNTHSLGTPLYAVLSSVVSSTSTDGDPKIYDNFYLVNDSYSTRYPDLTSSLYYQQI